MKITLIERSPVRVATVRYTGRFGEALARFWRKKFGPWLAVNGLLDCPRYGVALDDPGATLPEQCRYDACVELHAGLSLPNVVESTVPGGRYAITHFRGTAAEIGPCWAEFVAAMLADPANRLDAARRPFEHYPRGSPFDPRTDVFACELCLPVVS